MSKQPEALRLAECLTRGDSGYSGQAAAELRRLSAVEAQQALEALEHVVRQAQENLVPTIHYGPVHDVMNNLRAALAEPVQEPVALKWLPAPRKTEWGFGMVSADVEIDRDHTLTLYCEDDQTAKVDAMFRRVFCKEDA